MDWYSIVKFLHVVSAMVWLGGGFTLLLLALLADRAGDSEGMMQVMQWVGRIGNRLFMPASLLTLVFGAILCWFWAGFSDLWIVIGLAGYFVSFCIGVLVFKPSADRMKEMLAREGISPAAIASARRILQIAKFDYTVMLIIVSAMVLKPSASDTPILAGMALAFAAGCVLALGGLRQVRMAAAPAAA